MNSEREPSQSGRRFRLKLLLAMMLVVMVITGVILYVSERTSAAEVQTDLQRDFESQLGSLHKIHEMREAALAERCRTLVRKPRIHAALEDGALDLLYPSARDELRDVMESEASATDIHGLHATFYRFLGTDGQVIAAPPNADVGELTAEEENALALVHLPDRQQIGYLRRHRAALRQTVVDQIIAMPIISTETQEVISALVVGFALSAAPADRIAKGVKSGIWTEGELYGDGLTGWSGTTLEAAATRAVATYPKDGGSQFVRVAGEPHLLFCKCLNPGSLFPPAYEVSIYPLAQSIARQRQLRWKILGAGAAVLLFGFVASHLLSGRLSVPVERLAIDSAENRQKRDKAEAALAATSEELQRSMRFSADASHQLKTPVAVLRAGLDELLIREDVSPEAKEEIEMLIHQTFRLGALIEDLLLLSQMDSGRLYLALGPVNLCQLIEAWLDDLSVLPDELELDVQVECPDHLLIEGEKRYTSVILQNLLENARKYNRPGGAVRVIVTAEAPWAVVKVINTGAPIPKAAREHVFERFHRAAVGENVPGHGLGLNLAWELTRLHGGDLRLVRSDGSETEFQVRFRLAKHTAAPAYHVT